MIETALYIDNEMIMLIAQTARTDTGHFSQNVYTALMSPIENTDKIGMLLKVS